MCTYCLIGHFIVSSRATALVNIHNVCPMSSSSVIMRRNQRGPLGVGSGRVGPWPLNLGHYVYIKHTKLHPLGHTLWATPSGPHPLGHTLWASQFCLGFYTPGVDGFTGLSFCSELEGTLCVGWSLGFGPVHGDQCFVPITNPGHPSSRAIPLPGPSLFPGHPSSPDAHTETPCVNVFMYHDLFCYHPA